MRRDALFELTDAVLTDPGPATLVRRSLNPCFRRRWSSACDALGDGTIDRDELRRLCVRALPAPAVGARPLWGLDGTTWARPAAKTSPERTFCRFVTGGRPAEGMVAGWEWQWLGMVADPPSSWVLPLDVARRGPHAGTATDLAIVQLRAVLTEYPDDAPRPVVVMDSHYGLGALIAAALPCDLLARLPARRNLYRRPGPRQTQFGAPRKHGALLQLHKPGTHGIPDRTTTIADPQRDWVQIDVWDHLHERATPTSEVSVMRVTVGRLPRRADPPDPLWLVWHGETDPQDPTQWWRWYEARFTIEHLFRFLKQELGWTSVQVNDATTADRWSALVLAAYWELWLARAERAAVRLPWERALVQLGTPGQVRRGFAALLPQLGTPARPPRGRGKAPGRHRGDRPGPRPRHPVHKRGPTISA